MGCRTATRWATRRTASSSRPRRLAPLSRRSRTTSAACTACSGTRRCCTRARPAGPRELPPKGAGIDPDWTPGNVVESTSRRSARRSATTRPVRPVRRGRLLGRRGPRQRAVGDQLTCVFVDHGLLREGEAEQVEKDFVAGDWRRPRRSSTPGAVPRRARRGHRPRDQAQDHRPRVHPRLRGGRADVVGPRRRGAPRQVPRPGHALPGRRRVRRRRGRGQHQEPPQRRRSARRPAVPARRAAAHALQGRGSPGRPRARRPRGHRLAPAVPRAGPGHPDHRRGRRRAARHPARGRRRSPARS